MVEISARLQTPERRFILLGSHGEDLKRAFEKDWQETSNYQFDNPKLLAHRGNYGVCGGYGDLHILDCDDLSRWEELAILPLIPSTFTIESRPGHRQYYVTCKDHFHSGGLYDPDKTELNEAGKPEYVHIGDIKAGSKDGICGGYVVGPGCRHPSGSIYQIAADAPIAEVSREHLQSIINKFRQSRKFNANYQKAEEQVKQARTKRYDEKDPLDSLRVQDIMPPAGNVTRSGDELRGDHPVHGSTNGGNYCINTVENLWHCKRCESGGGPALAIAVKEGLISCSDAAPGVLRGDLFKQVLKIAREKYGMPGSGNGPAMCRREPDASEISVSFEELTEGGNASRLERIHGDDLRYNHTHKKWYLWNNGRWKIDTNGGAMRLAGDVVGSLYLAASKADGKDARDALSSFAKATDTRKGLSNMLVLAANRLTFALTSDDFDRDAWLLGVGNVTIDLKTGSPHETRREDLITKAIGARYDKAAQCPLWLKFLGRIFPDEELRKYIKRAVGYCLTGSMAEQVFFFCYGMGANGKSVFLSVLGKLLGEYAEHADFSTFLVQRNEKVRNDLASLAGARVITAIEAEEGGRLSMQVIKSWTGGDPVTARFLFGENFTFQPQGKLWLAANNKPAITERNHAAWRRVRLIPFTATIPEAERVKEYEKTLYSELPGILNWALEGLKEYIENGLDAPKAVTDATAEYRQENDSLEQFISECCEVEKLKACKNSDLYCQYANFCRMSGLTALSQTRFSPELASRPGISSTRSKHGIDWTGIALKKDWCRVEDNPTSQAVDVNGVGLSQNAQSIEKSPLREDFAHLTPNPTPHIDSNPTPYTKRAPKEEKGRKDPGFAKFKAGMAKRKCCLCGRTFSYDLTSYYNNGVSGYICATCHMQGPPPEPEKADSQTKLEAGQ